MVNERWRWYKMGELKKMMMRREREERERGRWCEVEARYVAILIHIWWLPCEWRKMQRKRLDGVKDKKTNHPFLSISFSLTSYCCRSPSNPFSTPSLLHFFSSFSYPLNQLINNIIILHFNFHFISHFLHLSLSLSISSILTL